MPRLVALFLAATIVCLSGSACKKTPQEDLEAKRQAAREQQRQKAARTYQDIITKYPDSKFAPMAQERLRTLKAEPQKK